MYVAPQTLKPGCKPGCCHESFEPRRTTSTHEKLTWLRWALVNVQPHHIYTTKTNFLMPQFRNHKQRNFSTRERYLSTPFFVTGNESTKLPAFQAPARFAKSQLLF